jgi:hypothetical protein
MLFYLQQMFNLSLPILLYPNFDKIEAVFSFLTWTALNKIAIE